MNVTRMRGVLGRLGILAYGSGKDGVTMFMLMYSLVFNDEMQCIDHILHTEDA